MSPVPVTMQPTDPACVALGHDMHAVVYEGRCLFCRPTTRSIPDDDDRGETLIRSTVQRDRYGRAR